MNDKRNKNKKDQLSELSFKFLKMESIKFKDLTAKLDKEEGFKPNTMLYYQDDCGEYHRANVTGCREDVSIDSSFTFFGFDSADPEVSTSVFYKDTYGESWFVVV